MAHHRKFLLCAAFFAAMVSTAVAQTAFDVKDAFGRSVATRGIALVEWEGFMANPAVKLTVVLPDGFPLPATLDVSSDCSRMMFDRSSQDRRGLGTHLRISGPERSATFWVSIFPSRSGRDEEHKVFVDLKSPDRSRSIGLELRVHVVNQDKPHRPAFQIHVDYSQDKTGFFKDPRVRRICEQAAEDWAFFIDDMALDSVKPHDERIDVWNPDGFVSTYPISNENAYNGFLLYMTGIRGVELRSGGAPSTVGKHQTSHGRTLPLLRSGNVNVEVQGDYHRLGWFLTTGEEDWWCSGSLGDEPADLYSIMLHEMGHALAFHPMYAAAHAALERGRWIDPEVRAYLGANPRYDRTDHFAGSVDPASGFGVFGAEYDARMKVRRWLITKAHLLLLKSVGYKIRPVSCFAPLTASYPHTGDLNVGSKAVLKPRASGGIPGYLWEVSSGSLPPGVSLDSFTGEISGAPSAAGSFAVKVRVTDQSPQTTTVEMPLTIAVR